jgi:hypothetical protein
MLRKPASEKVVASTELAGAVEHAWVVVVAGEGRRAASSSSRGNLSKNPFMM